MSAYGDCKVPMNNWNMRGTPRKLMCFVLYRKQRFMDRFFLFSEWISASTKDRSRRERRPGASVLAPKIWSRTLRLFLLGVRKRSSLCTISTNNFGRPKNPYHNCGKLSDARHSSGVERIQVPSRCYLCGRRGAHWTFIVSIIKCNLRHICHWF
jgi:hypothetical protein